MKNGAVGTRAADAGVGDVTHSSIGVAVVAKETLHLVLHVSRLDGEHDLFVSLGRNPVRVADHFQLHVGLENAQLGDDRVKQGVVHCSTWRLEID